MGLPVQVRDSWQRLTGNKRIAIAAAIAVMLIGTVFMLFSLAAGSTTDAEAESGTLSGGATKVTDASASGGSAIKFGVQAATTMTFTLNGATTYQTMDGFGTSINVHSWDNGNLKPALDLLIDQDSYQIFRVVMEMQDWEKTNDNSDPNTFNWTYYNPIYDGTTSFDTAQKAVNFADLWNVIDYLHSKGIPDNQIILSNMGPGPSWNGGNTITTTTQTNEWVEMVTSEAYYGYTHGHTFGLFSPNNEEDILANEGITMSGTVYGDAMNKVALKLDALGLTNIRLLGPETATPNIYWDNMQPYSTLMGKIDHLDFHSYTQSTNGADADVKAAYGTTKNFWISEFALFDDVFPLLTQGPSAIMMWDAYDSVYNHAIVNGHGSTPPNDTGNAPPQIAYNTTTKVYTPRQSFYQFRQVFKYVQPGAKRVSITSSKTGVKAVAFVNTTTGAITIVGYNTTASQQVIGGTMTNVPAASTFHYSRTNSSSNMAAGSDVNISGGAFTATVPANTVFTLTTL